MRSIKISKKDLKLLIIILSLAVLWVCYYFIYVDNMKKVDAINSDITKLETRYSDLQKKVNDKDKIVKENETLKGNYQTMVSSYGNGASEEKSMIFVKDLQDNTGMEVNSITFADPVFLFNGTNTVNQANSEGADLDKANSELSKSTGEKKDQTDNKTQVDAKLMEGLKSLSGYRETISITFRSTYEDFKKSLDYINNYKEKCNAGDITVSYDSETGNVSGSMNINMYHLIGKGINYVPPTIGDIKIGTDNIFGTIEIPPEKEKDNQ